MIMRGRVGEHTRGRPRGSLQSIAAETSFAYLIWISKNHGVDSTNLFKSFVEAWKNGYSLCGNISIRCRCKIEECAVFLITKGDAVVAQLRLSEKMLERLPEMKPSPELMERIRVKKKEQPSAAIEQQIKDMYFGAKGFNLRAKVVEKSAVRKVFSRFGQPLLVSNATLSDGTGSIKLPLWNSHIDTVSVGDTVRIENGRVKRFNGELLLNYSKLSVSS